MERCALNNALPVLVAATSGLRCPAFPPRDVASARSPYTVLYLHCRWCMHQYCTGSTHTCEPVSVSCAHYSPFGQDKRKRLARLYPDQDRSYAGSRSPLIPLPSHAIITPIASKSVQYLPDQLPSMP
ncbi:hypothetical protein F5Y12DRAFT_512058 [Xylaria sp. FL1777]|nr:hypothetical protein F5Y12DRAFT_512058 [Xylaria sp. FL1777]